MSVRRASRLGPSASAWLAALSLALVPACGADAIVALGTGGPVPLFGDSGQRVRSVNDRDSAEHDATLSVDLLEIYFISDRGDGLGDVWHAQRRDRTLAFDPPRLLAAVSSAAEEASPVISPDGLTLWFASRREGGQGGLDVWRATRPSLDDEWQSPENLAALNGPGDDLPRPLGAGDSIMPLVSDREGGVRQTFFVRRSSPGTELDSIEPLESLWLSGSVMEDAFLTDDGLLLFFRRAEATPGAAGELFVAWRATAQEPFREPVPLPGVNSAGEDADPFLSADRIRFFFSSDRRDGTALDIYATSIALPDMD